MRSRWLLFLFLCARIAVAQPLVIDRPAQGFIPNQGQWPKEVLAQLPTETARIWIMEKGFRFTLRGPEEVDSADLFVFSETFEGAARGQFVGSLPLAGSLTFYSPLGYAAAVPQFAEGAVHGLYPGVTLELSLSPDGFLKTNWVGERAQDLARVASTFEGLPSGTPSGGNHITFDLPVGNLTISLPQAGNVRKALHAHWEEEQGQWHPKAKGATWIDPVYRFSTFSGSISDNFGYTATYDGLGRTWLGGIAFGTQFPVANGIQSSYAGGGTDVVLMLFSPDGTGLRCGTYFGGSNREQPHSMMAAPNGDLVVMGTTGSADLPHTSNGYDTTFGGGTSINGGGQSLNSGSDIFLLRLDSTGGSLLGMTYLGGTGNDGINANLALNYGDQARGEVLATSNAVFIATSTLSSDFPTSAGGQASHGMQEGVLARLTPGLDILSWSTYIGGDQADGIFGASLVQMQGQEKLFAVGASYSDSLGHATAYQAQRSGLQDAWVVRVDAGTGAVEKSTYVGTTGPDVGFMVAHQPEGAFKAVGDSTAIAIVGNTRGIMSSTTGIWNQNMSSQYMAWLDANLDTLYRIQTFGSGTISSSNCSPTAFMMDACGSLYFSGWGGLANNGGNTQNLFTTADAYQSTTDGSDFYFLVLNRKGSPLYASYFGGSPSYEHVDGGTSRFDPAGVIHQAICAGCGGNSNLPIFPHNAYSLTNNAGNCNMAAVQIAFALQAASVQVDLVSDTLCAGNQALIKGSLGLCDSVFVDWGDGAFSAGGLQPPFSHAYGQSGPYLVTVSAFDTVCATQSSQQLSVFVSNPDPPRASMNLVYSPCDTALHVELHPTDSLVSNALQVFWGDGSSHYERMQCPLIHNYRGIYGPTTITLIALDTLCGGADTVTYVVQFRPPLGTILGEIVVNPCGDVPIITGAAEANFATHIFWYPNGFGSAPMQGRERLWQGTPGAYTVPVIVWDSVCDRRDTLMLSYDVVGPDDPDGMRFPNMFTPNGDGMNDAFCLSQSAASSLQSLDLIIYDRWGQKVFSSHEPNFAWDGQFRSRALLDGVYFYVAQWTTTCGTSATAHGAITLNKTVQ